MIVEKGHFLFAGKYWEDQGPPAPPPPCSDGLDVFSQNHVIIWSFDFMG